MGEQGAVEGIVAAQGEVAGRAFAEALAETTQSLVCVLDRDGRILLFNDACERATGFTREEVIGRDAREVVIPPEEAEAFGDVLAAIWATRLPSPQVGHWMTREGGRLLVAWSNKPVLDADGETLYIVTAGLDISERERTAADVRALEGDLEAKLGEVGRLAQEQRGLRRVATLVASEETHERVFAAVSEEAARVLGVGAAAVFRYEADGSARVVGQWNRRGGGEFALGTSVPTSGDSAIARVRAAGAPARIDDYGPLPGQIAETMQRIGYASTIAAPILVAGGLWGVVAVTTFDTLPAESEARLGDFCKLVSLAIASSQTREDLRASRARIVQTADNERRRLERNLHDGAQQRLVSLGMTLRLLRSRLQPVPEAVAPLLERAVADVEGAIQDLRELARGLHPAVLGELGLRPALEGLAIRAPLRVEVTHVPDDRLPEPIEAAVYYIVAEALTNVAKHAYASSAEVAVRRDGSSVLVEVVDDGRGGADPSAGSGIVGLRDRVDALGGSLSLESPRAGGTVVRASLPVTSIP